MLLKRFLLMAIAPLTLLAFTGFNHMTQSPIPVVQDFKVENYLGKWYELARLDFRWEKNLSQVTAEYSLRDDGKIRVDNRGYDTIKKKWDESIGKPNRLVKKMKAN